MQWMSGISMPFSFQIRARRSVWPVIFVWRLIRMKGGIVEAKRGPLTFLARGVGLSCSIAPYISRARSNRSKLDI